MRWTRAMARPKFYLYPNIAVYKGLSIGFYLNDISFVWNYFLLCEWSWVGEKWTKFGRKFHKTDIQNTRAKRTKGIKIWQFTCLRMHFRKIGHPPFPDHIPQSCRQKLFSTLVEDTMLLLKRNLPVIAVI